MADWVGIAETTIRDHIREVEIDVMRNRKWLAKLQADGRVTFGHSGTEMDWRIRYKRAIPKGYADMDTVSFPRRNRHKTAVLGWRASTLDESISKFDKLKNRGTPAIVKILETKVNDMTEDMEEWFGDQLYIDGNATGNSKKIHGIESFLGNTGADSNGFVAVADDSYAGLNTVLGSYGGSVLSGSWPTGTFTTDYDFYTPLIVDYSDTAWAAATKTWPNTCEEALAYGIINLVKNKSARGRANMVLLSVELYRQFREKIRGKEQINITQGTSGPTAAGGGKSLYSLGFGDVINYEGCEVSYEYGVPVDAAGNGIGYIFNTAQMELCSMQDTLFDFGIQKKYEEVDKTLRFSIDFFGNMKFRPRYFGKLAKVT